jgi:acetyl-CoA carboxylase biotin carboxyl carrier protein
VDIEKVRELVKLMVDQDLLSISLRDGDEEITLKRPGKNDLPLSMSQAQPATNPIVQVRNITEPMAPAPVEPSPVITPDEGLVTVESPMVGTFYTAASPEANAFVEIGSRVVSNSVICIIEAMKVFNEIRAELSGTIERILVGNGQPVEFGQPLFMVRPS